MRYATYKIERDKSYGITIGSRVKPDSELRELIGDQINKAMESFERESDQAHSLTILPDWDPVESGLPDIPPLEPLGQYLIFALLYSPPDSAESLTNRELELYREELGRMFEEITESTRAALVLLRDCTVSVIESRKGAYSGGVFL